MGVQPAQLCQSFPAAAQAQAGFEILPCLTPEFVAQAQAAQGQQKFGIVGAVLEPLLGDQQLLIRFLPLDAAVEVDELVTPVVPQHLAQQGLGLGLVAQLGQEAGVIPDGVFIPAQESGQLVPQAGQGLQRRFRILLACPFAFLGCLLQQVVPDLPFQFVELRFRQDIPLAQFRQQPGQLPPVLEPQVGVLQQFQHERMVR